MNYCPNDRRQIISYICWVCVRNIRMKDERHVFPLLDNRTSLHNSQLITLYNRNTTYWKSHHLLQIEVVGLTCCALLQLRRSSASACDYPSYCVILHCCIQCKVTQHHLHCYIKHFNNRQLPLLLFVWWL